MAEAIIKQSPAGLIVGSVLAVVGIVCWIMQIMGVGGLALGNHVVWGLYIVGFTLCTGIAAGCLLFASSTVLFVGLAAYRAHARLAAFASVVIGTLGAGLFIMADLGSPDRAWEMVAFAHPGSPLFWDAIILTTYLVVGMAFTLYLVKSAKDGSDAGALKPLAVAAFVAGACVAITSFVFVFQVARPSWSNPGQTLSFVLSALIASGSVLMVVFALANRSGYLPFDERLSGGLAKALGVVVSVELVFVLTEVVLGLFSAVGDEAVVATWLTVGSGAPFFWIEVVAFLTAIVFFFRKNRGFQVAGALVALLAVFLVKYNMLQVEFFNPILSFASFMDSSGIVEGFYAPSLIEWGVAVGIFGLGSALLALGMRKLKLGA